MPSNRQQYNHSKNSSSSSSSRYQTQYKNDSNLKSLRFKYKHAIKPLYELFPEWSQDDLLFVMEECQGDLNLAIARISEGHASQWDEVKIKRPKPQPQQPQDLHAPRSDSTHSKFTTGINGERQQQKYAHNRNKDKGYQKRVNSYYKRSNKDRKQKKEDKQVAVAEQPLKPSWASILKKSIEEEEEAKKKKQKEEENRTVAAAETAVDVSMQEQLAKEPDEVQASEEVDSAAVEGSEAETVEERKDAANYPENEESMVDNKDETSTDIALEAGQDEAHSPMSEETEDVVPDDSKADRQTDNDAINAIEENAVAQETNRNNRKTRLLNQVEAVVLPENQQINPSLDSTAIHVKFGTLNLTSASEDEQENDGQEDEQTVKQMAVGEAERESATTETLKQQPINLKNEAAVPPSSPHPTLTHITAAREQQEAAETAPQTIEKKELSPIAQAFQHKPLPPAFEPQQTAAYNRVPVPSAQNPPVQQQQQQQQQQHQMYMPPQQSLPYASYIPMTVGYNASAVDYHTNMSATTAMGVAPVPVPGSDMNYHTRAPIAAPSTTLNYYHPTSANSPLYHHHQQQQQPSPSIPPLYMHPKREEVQQHHAPYQLQQPTTMIDPMMMSPQQTVVPANRFLPVDNSTQPQQPYSYYYMQPTAANTNTTANHPSMSYQPHQQVQPRTHPYHQQQQPSPIPPYTTHHPRHPQYTNPASASSPSNATVVSNTNANKHTSQHQHHHGHSNASPTTAAATPTANNTTTVPTPTPTSTSTTPHQQGMTYSSMMAAPYQPYMYTNALNYSTTTSTVASAPPVEVLPASNSQGNGNSMLPHLIHNQQPQPQQQQPGAATVTPAHPMTYYYLPSQQQQQQQQQYWQ